MTIGEAEFGTAASYDSKDDFRATNILGSSSRYFVQFDQTIG